MNNGLKKLEIRNGKWKNKEKNDKIKKNEGYKSLKLRSEKNKS